MKKSVKIECTGSEMVALKDLVIIQKNLKELSKTGYQKLRKQILVNGFSAPFFVWKNKGKLILLDGNQRLRALTKMKAEDTELPAKFPAVMIEAKDEKQARHKLLSFVSQYGTTTEEGMYEFSIDSGFDAEFLKDNFDIPNIDMDRFIDGYFKNEKDDSSEDEVPAVPNKSKTNTGDVYILGDHRLMCGDSAKSEDVEKLMSGDKADMVFTDPPYGVNMTAKNKLLNDHTGQARLTTGIHGDDFSLKDLKPIIQGAFANIHSILADKSCYYIASPQGGELGLMMMMQEAGIPCRHMIVWVKNAPVFSLGRLDYDYQHEPILYGWAKNKTHHKSSLKGQWTKSTWHCDREQNKLHPTMKPVALVENAITNSTQPGMICADLFGGSGSTLIACEKTGRKARVMEIDPRYCDVIISRFEEFSGKRAQLIRPSAVKLRKPSADSKKPEQLRA